MKHWPFVLVFVALSLVPLVPPVYGNPYESFESAEKSWQLGPRDCRLEIILHERRFAEAHAGSGCEFFHLSSGPGTSIQLVHPVTPARVIPELLPSLWIKSDRPGLQLQGRVVFPRSLDKQGQPFTTFVFGDSYTDAKAWRQLRIEDVARKVQRAAVQLRMRPGITVDEREAYIDRLVLNAFTGPGDNRVWIDDLELAGFVAASDAPRTADRASPNLQRDGPGEPAVPGRTISFGLRGNVLLADDRPIFVRAVEHQGETFAFLQSLGFNAVMLGSAATDAQLAEARRADVWLVTPPPRTQTGIEIRAEHQQVIAWFAGEQLTSRDDERVNRLLLDTRLAETQPLRPVVVRVASGPSRYHQENSVSLLERPVVGTSFELNDFGPWLHQHVLRGRRDSPYWVAIASEPPLELQEQVVSMSGLTSVPLFAEPDLVRRLAYDAVARGARGLWFPSSTRLDQRDGVTRLRAATLRALNRELELIAPWVAAGTAAGEREVNNPWLRVLSLRTESARLFIAVRIVSDQQHVVAPARGGEPMSFAVHNTPSSNRAYAVAPHEITPLAVQRGGGIQVTLGDDQSVSLVLLTQDPWAINYVNRVAAEIRDEYAACQTEIAELLIEETEVIDQQLTRRQSTRRAQDPQLARARAELRHAKLLLEGGDSRNAIQRAASCLEACRRIRRARWESTSLNFPSPVSSPLCTSFSTLPLHFAAADRLARSPWSVNALAAGEMEQFDHLLQSGWRQQRIDAEAADADVRLTPDAPRSGRSCLHIRVWKEGGGPGGFDGQPPVTITSAPVLVRAGQLVRIHGWAKVPQRYPDSWDGLMIFDSQSGPALAERIDETQGWREFLLYRVARSTGELRVVFAQTGTGESWLDEISVTLQDSFAAEQVEHPVRIPPANPPLPSVE